MEKLQVYKGIEIYFDGDIKNPIVTVQKDIPVIGVLQHGHKTIDDAKLFIDGLMVNNK